MSRPPMSHDALDPEDFAAGIAASGSEHVAGWNSQRDVFNRLVGEVRPKVIVAIGTWLGASAIDMAKAVPSLGLPTKIECSTARTNTRT